MYRRNGQRRAKHTKPNRMIRLVVAALHAVSIIYHIMTLRWTNHRRQPQYSLANRIVTTLAFMCAPYICIWLCHLTRGSADADKPARHVQRSIKVTKHGTIRYVRYGFLLVCYSNFVLKTCHFQIFDFKKMSWPWDGHRATRAKT